MLIRLLWRILVRLECKKVELACLNQPTVVLVGHGEKIFKFTGLIFQKSFSLSCIVQNLVENFVFLDSSVVF